MNSPQKTRLLILTDITSLEAGVREPDDAQSLIRLMLHSCDFALEGLVASSNLGHGQVCRPDLIHQVLDAYAQDRPALLRHRPDYPPVEHLRALVREGQPVADRKEDVFASIGPGKDTEASRHIIAAVDRGRLEPGGGPLWIAIWGGAADLAQALWRVREERSPAELAQFLSGLRVNAVADQDSTGPWIKEEFPALPYVTQRHGFRGMYRGGDTTLVSAEWVATHIHGHGALGALYPSYRGGDPWGRVFGIKEGDTPSFLSLLPVGLNDGLDPCCASWGGKMHRGEPTRWEDAEGPEPKAPGDRHGSWANTHRWRPAFQAEFAARLDWCRPELPPAEASSAPVVQVQGVPPGPVKAGALVELDASASTGPEGRGTLRFHWLVDQPEGAAKPPGNFAFATPDTAAECRFTMPAMAELHLLVAVTTAGDPPLTRYQRVILKS